MSKKDNVAFILMITITILFFIVIGRTENIYSIDTEVVSIEDDVIVLESLSGNLWEYSLPDNDFKIGTKIKCYIDSMGTENTLKDDVILKLKVTRD